MYNYKGELIYKFIFYDSIQALKLEPFYAQYVDSLIGNNDFTEQLNHIFICYADKEEQNFMGQSSWGYDVDVEI